MPEAALCPGRKGGLSRHTWPYQAGEWSRAVAHGLCGLRRWRNPLGVWCRMQEWRRWSSVGVQRAWIGMEADSHRCVLAHSSARAEVNLHPLSVHASGASVQRQFQVDRAAQSGTLGQQWLRSSVDRAFASGAKGRAFESRRSRHLQPVELLDGLLLLRPTYPVVSRTTRYFCAPPGCRRCGPRRACARPARRGRCAARR